MFENINNSFIKPEKSNVETRDSKTKKFLEAEKSMSTRFHGKAGKVLRMMIIISGLTLGAGVVGTGIYEIAHFESQSAEKMNEIHKGTGVILEKTYHRAVNEGFDEPYYSLKINMEGKVIEAEVSESIFQDVVRGRQLSFQYHDRGSLSGPTVIINSLEQQAK